MTRSLVEHFESLGLPPADAVSRDGLVSTAASGFASRFGVRPRWRWFVPGRVEVFGKHVDYAGGRSLLAAVPRGFALVASPRTDRLVCVVDVRDGSSAQVVTPGAAGATSSDANPPGAVSGPGWSRYVRAVVERLAANFPGASLGIDIALASDLPRSAGLSSSSALIVGIASALACRARLTERAEWRESVASPTDLAWYLGCVENGADFRTLSGAAGVGTRGGSEDHTAIVTCRSGHVSLYGFVPTVHHGDTPVPDAWTFVIAASGVRADKAGSVRERYNRASLSTRALLDVWNARAAEPAECLSAALRSSGEAGARLDAWIAAGHREFSAEELRTRLEHFRREDARAPLAAAAFSAADREALGRLAEASQADADGLLGNQTPETRALADLARRHGAFASSSFGAGFGGSVWALADATDAPRVERDWLDAYRRRFPSVDGVESFIIRPGPAIAQLPD